MKIVGVAVGALMSACAMAFPDSRVTFLLLAIVNFQVALLWASNE